MKQPVPKSVKLNQNITYGLKTFQKNVLAPIPSLLELSSPLSKFQHVSPLKGESAKFRNFHRLCILQNTMNENFLKIFVPYFPNFFHVEIFKKKIQKIFRGVLIGENLYSSTDRPNSLTRTWIGRQWRYIQGTLFSKFQVLKWISWILANFSKFKIIS